MNIIDIIERYDKYIADQNEINRQKRYAGNENWLQASGAGGCFLKHLFAQAGIEKVDLSLPINRRLMRLGTIVHGDIQASLDPTEWKNATKSVGYDGNELLIEHEITLPMFNVRGHLDIADINHKEKIITVLDIKTTASYKWSFIFGRSVDAKPSMMYQLQIATYAMGLAQQFPGYEIMMWLDYYKKDNSDFREKPVGTDNLMHAATYWGEVNEFIEANVETVKQLDKIAELKTTEDGNSIMARENFKSGIKQFCNPGNQLSIPCSSFECNPLYCDYTLICPSTLHSSKKK